MMGIMKPVTLVRLTCVTWQPCAAIRTSICRVYRYPLCWELALARVGVDVLSKAYTTGIRFTEWQVQGTNCDEY